MLNALTIAAATLALLSSTAATESASATSRGSCSSLGGQTVLRTRTVRIFTLPGRFSTNRDFYGCLARRGSPFRLSLVEYEGVIVNKRLIRVAGRYATLVQTIPSQDTSGDLVVVRSLTTGRAVYVGPRGTLGMVRDVVSTPTGAAAFIYDPGAAVREVRVTRPKDIAVDHGPDIDPNSLELSRDGRSVIYVKAGERRVAPIP